MAKRIIKLGQLVSTDPEAAAGQIVSALNEHDLNMTRAAATMGVDVSTLRRWVAKLEALGLISDVEASRRHPIGALVRSNPDRAARELIRLMKRYGGSLLAASEAEGLDVSTLYRWIDRLNGSISATMRPTFEAANSTWVRGGRIEA